MKKKKIFLFKFSFNYTKKIRLDMKFFVSIMASSCYIIKLNKEKKVELIIYIKWLNLKILYRLVGFSWVNKMLYLTGFYRL